MSDNNPAGLQTIHFSAEEYSLHFFVLEKYIEYRLLLSKKRSQEIVNNTFSWLDNTNVYVYNLSPLVRYANILVFISKEGKWQFNKGQNLFNMTQKQLIWAMNRKINTRIWKNGKRDMEKVKIEYGENRKTILCKITYTRCLYKYVIIISLYDIYLILL